MNKQQAGEVIQYVIDLFDLDMTDKQIKAWAVLLMERGDYEETMKNVKRRATNGKRFKPTISEIIIKHVKKNNFKNEYDETKSHAYKKRNDEQYAQVIKKLEGLRNKLYKEVEQDEE